MIDNLRERQGEASGSAFMFGGFDALRPSALPRILLDIGRRIKVASGRPFPQRGDDAIFLLLAGEVSLRIVSQAGNEIILRTYHEGDILFAPSTDPGGAFYIRLMGEEDSSLRVASREDCLSASVSADLIDQEIKVISHRLTFDYLRFIHELAFMPIAQRLYSEILRQDANARAMGRSSFLLSTHQVLASALATSRETISREVSFLRKERVIQSDGRDTKLLDRGFIIRKIRVALDLASEDDVLRSIGIG